MSNIDHLNKYLADLDWNFSFVVSGDVCFLYLVFFYKSIFFKSFPYSFNYFFFLFIFWSSIKSLAYFSPTVILSSKTLKTLHMKTKLSWSFPISSHFSISAINTFKSELVSLNCFCVDSLIMAIDCAVSMLPMYFVSCFLSSGGC